MEQKTFETQGFVHDLSPLKQLKKAWLERLKHERSEGARDMLVVPSFDSKPSAGGTSSKCGTSRDAKDTNEMNFIHPDCGSELSNRTRYRKM